MTTSNDKGGRPRTRAIHPHKERSCPRCNSLHVKITKTVQPDKNRNATHRYFECVCGYVGIYEGRKH